MPNYDNMRVCVPSFQRADQLEKKTLAFLRRVQFPMDRVDVFIADEPDERAAYEYLNDTEVNVHLGVRGLVHQRLHIVKHYPEGTEVLALDDDIQDVKAKVGEKKVQSIDSLKQLSTEGFTGCRAANTKLWGIYPTVNAMFMKYRMTFDCRLIIGAFWGMIVDHDPALQPTMSIKEDYERTVMFYKRFGAIARLNWYGIVTKYYGTGGLEHERTKGEHLIRCKELLERYPQYITWARTKSYGYAEINCRSPKR